MCGGAVTSKGEMRYLQIRFPLTDGQWHMVEAIITDPNIAEAKK